MAAFYFFILILLLSFSPSNAQENVDTLDDSPFTKLPKELQVHIYSFLTWEDLTATSNVSRDHRNLSSLQRKNLLNKRSPKAELILSAENYSAATQHWPLIKHYLDRAVLRDLSLDQTKNVFGHMQSWNQINTLVLQSYKTTPNLVTQPSTIDLTPLQGIPNLKTLSLRSCNLTDEHLEQMGPLLGTLQQLYLDHNMLTAKGIHTLCPYLSSSLKVLSLGHNSLGQEGLSTLINKLNQLPELRLLDISNSGLQPDNLLELCETFPPNLKFLYLDNCEISDENQRHLSKESIKSKPALLSFIIFLNHLKKFAQLDELCLSSNRLSSLGVAYLNKAINVMEPQRPVWKVLDLSFNDLISAEAIQSLKNMMKNLPNLTEVDLTYTSLSQQNIEELRKNEKDVKIKFKDLQD